MTQDSNAEIGTAGPYAVSHVHSEPATEPARLNLPAWIAVVCCVASLGLWLVTLVVSLPYGHPNAPPLIEILGFTGIFMVLPALGLAGAVSMLKRKRYTLSLIGASCMVVPLLGPCFGLTIPLGIWSLILLRRKPVRDSFAPSLDQSPDAYPDADDARLGENVLSRFGLISSEANVLVRKQHLDF